MGTIEPPVIASRPANPVLLPILTAMGTTHAFEIGTLVVIMRDILLGSEPSEQRHQVEAGLLAIAIALVLVLSVKLRVALKKHDEEALHGCAVLVVVAIIGGFFAILSKTRDATDGFGDQTERSLYFFVVISVILLTPFISATWDSLGLRRFGQIYRAMMQVTFVALLITGLQQFIFEYAYLLPLGALNVALASGGADFGSTGFYISAPMVAALFAPWAFLTVQPVVRPEQWNLTAPYLWVAAYLILGVLFIAGFVKLIYLPDHEMATWLVQFNDAEKFYLTFRIFLLLQAPLLVMPVLAMLCLRGRLADWLIVIASVGLGTLCSWLLVNEMILPLRLDYNSVQKVAFVIAHSTAAGGTTFALLQGSLEKIRGKEALSGNASNCSGQ
ncbi:MAG: hypothetical protein AB8B71_09235 [Paracoccaceae bacterium]